MSHFDQSLLPNDMSGFVNFSIAVFGKFEHRLQSKKLSRTWENGWERERERDKDRWCGCWLWGGGPLVNRQAQPFSDQGYDTPSLLTVVKHPLIPLSISLFLSWNALTIPLCCWSDQTEKGSALAKSLKGWIDFSLVLSKTISQKWLSSINTAL